MTQESMLVLCMCMHVLCNDLGYYKRTSTKLQLLPTKVGSNCYLQNV